ncbi:MAG: DUF1080 domain-containing protein [Novipirellula sp. JB048]
MPRLNRSLFSLCLALLTLTAVADEPAAAGAADTSEFVTLFNGKDLDGWDGDPRFWTVKDGAIRGESTPQLTPKGNTFLIWTGGTLKDFELRMSFRCTEVNNSGIQYRSSRVSGKGVRNDWVVKGYQYEIRNENTLPNVPAFIYDERGKRGRICLVGEKAVWTEEGKKVLDDSLIDDAGFKKLMKIDDWNDVVIIAKGNHIQHFLNGKLVLDFTDEHPELALSEGVLALQIHAGAPMWTEFKNIQLREIK